MLIIEANFILYKNAGQIGACGLVAHKIDACRCGSIIVIVRISKRFSQ